MPKRLAPALWIALTVISALAVEKIAIESRWLWALGWTYPGFYSSDYFPVLPWVFVFLLGTCAGEPIREERLPKWFYETRVPLFPAVGRHAFIIYLAHQPVLYGVTMLIVFLTSR